MSEYGYVELPILGWLCGEPKEPKYGDRGLGWTYRDEAAMAAYDRPLEDPLVEKLLVEAILRVNPSVKTEAQAKLAVGALRKTMSHPDKLTANRNYSPRLVWRRGTRTAETAGGCGIGGQRYGWSSARGIVTAPGRAIALRVASRR